MTLKFNSVYTTVNDERLLHHAEEQSEDQRSDCKDPVKIELHLSQRRTILLQFAAIAAGMKYFVSLTYTGP